MQKNAVEESMAVFQAETVGISAINSVKYLEKLMVRRKYWSYNKVFHKMKREHASYSYDRPLILYIYLFLRPLRRNSSNLPGETLHD